MLFPLSPTRKLACDGSGHYGEVTIGDEEAPKLAAPRSWPAISPPSPRPWRFFCCGRRAGGLCPPTCLAFPVLSVIFFVLGFGMIAAALVAICVLYALLGLGLCCGSSWLVSWNYQGNGSWVGNDLYMKQLYIVYQGILLTWGHPMATEEFMPISGLKPKRRLKKKDIDYALHITVPNASECEFVEDPTWFENFMSENLAKMYPSRDDLTRFQPDEDPVVYVMGCVGNVYPHVKEDWLDKQSDIALTRFVLHGIGAERIETVTEGGSKFYVVRTNAMSGLPVRGKFASYGGDAYFDADWRVVKIVDKGFVRGKTTVTRPSDANWLHAKFRFRSSLSVLVTLVDHLYAVHLQASNVFIMALHEHTSPEHPVRRFLTPFTYNTFLINANARKNLIQPKSMGPRNFAFTPKGIALAFAAAPNLVMSGMEVPKSEGGPYVDRRAYYQYLKEKRGIDTEYNRQASRLYGIFYRFIQGYMECYYATTADIVHDQELKGMLTQFFGDTELSLKNMIWDPDDIHDADEASSLWMHAMANFMWIVTAGHEQTGAIQAYVQDASFCAFKWLPGENVATKESALLQALLMSFTSQAMPKLMGGDWTYLFPPVPQESMAHLPRLGEEGGLRQSDPKVVFRTFQAELEAMAMYCDQYNAAATQRPFPFNFPMSLHPRDLETSISV